jgi:putative redox protein
MRVVARRRQGFAHDVDIEGGAHRLLVDEPLAAGGDDAGPSPTRLLAAGLASCIAVTIEMYAERKGWDVGAVEVEVDVAYDGFLPSAFDTTIRLPASLDEEQRERLLAVSRKCPVQKVLSGATAVNLTHRIETA